METERLLLRKLKMQDATKIEEYAGDYQVAKTTLSIPHPYPKGGGISYIQAVDRSQKYGKLVIFALEEKSSGQFVGVINLNFIKPHRRAELAYWIGTPFWGKGYGTEVAKRVVEYGFNELGLNKINAMAFLNNPGSWRIMEKLGCSAKACCGSTSSVSTKCMTSCTTAS